MLGIDIQSPLFALLRVGMGQAANLDQKWVDILDILEIFQRGAPTSNLGIPTQHDRLVGFAHSRMKVMPQMICIDHRGPSPDVLPPPNKDHAKG